MDDMQKPTFGEEDFSEEAYVETREEEPEGKKKKGKKEKSPSSKSSKIRIIGGLLLLCLVAAAVYQFALGGGSSKQSDLVTTTPDNTTVPESSVTPSTPEGEGPASSAEPESATLDPAAEKVTIKYTKYTIIPSAKLCDMMTTKGQEKVAASSQGASDCKSAIEEKSKALKEIAGKKDWKKHKKAAKKAAREASISPVSASATKIKVSVKTRTSSPISEEKRKYAYTLVQENGEWLVAKTNAFK